LKASKIPSKIGATSISIFVLLRQSALSMVGFGIVMALVFVGLFANFIAPYNPYAVTSNILQPPSFAHLAGTDELGRDVFSRILYGARIDLQVGVIVVFAAVLIGATLGVISGYVGGFVDGLIMRITDVFLGFPSFVLALALAAALGRGLFSSEIALSVSLFPWYSRLVRSQALKLRSIEFVAASKSIGSSPLQIMRWHVLPNTFVPILINGSLDLAKAILLASALGFLGIGAQEPTAEWGLMMATGQNYIFSAWWVITFPGIAIMTAVLGFNLLGDGLSDVFGSLGRV
jgi:peptide/nickel transport system permease protein